MFSTWAAGCFFTYLVVLFVQPHYSRSELCFNENSERWSRTTKNAQPVPGCPLSSISLLELSHTCVRARNASVAVLSDGKMKSLLMRERVPARLSVLRTSR